MEYEDLNEMLEVLNYDHHKAESYSDIVNRIIKSEEKHKFLFRIISRSDNDEIVFHAKPIYLLLRKLVKDGYIDDYTGTSEKTGLTEDILYSINYDGIMFLKDGSYDNKNKKEKREQRRQIILDYALILGASVGVVAGAYSLINLLWNLFCNC